MITNLKRLNQSLIALILILGTCSVGLDASSFTLAEFSHNLINGDCPKPLSNQTKPTCEITVVDHFRKLQTFTKKLDENTYFAGLASRRAISLKCAEQQIDTLEKNKEKLGEFLDFYSDSLIQLAREKAKLNSLLPAITIDEKARLEYKNTRARAEVILKSLPFADVPAMRLMINSVVSQSDYGGQKEIDPAIRKSIRETIQTSLLKTHKEVKKNYTVIADAAYSSGRVLSNEVKESLAQDTDLIESFRQQSGISETDLKPIACQVDARYGRGAVYRDNVYLAGFILGPIVVAGVESFAAMRLASAVTGASALGTFSVTTASILRTVTSLAVGASIIQQIEQSCFPEVSLKGTPKEMNVNKCDTDILKSIKDTNCAATIALSALGGKVVYKSVKSNLMGPSTAVQRAETSAVNLSGEGFAIARNAESPDMLKFNKALMSSYNKKAAKVDVNKTIKTTSINLDIPSNMIKRTERLRETINKTPFDQPIYQRKNNFTTAGFAEKPVSFLPGDKQMSQGLLNAFEDLHDKQKFADYVDNLIAETTRKMLKSANPALKEKAADGVLDQETLISVLSERMKARGLPMITIPKDSSVLSPERFREYLSRGPIVDEALGPGSSLASSHGVYPHILQLDYVLPSIAKQVGEDRLPVVFQYLGTERGLKFWNESFDLFSGQSSALTNTTVLKKIIMNPEGLNLP